MRSKTGRQGSDSTGRVQTELLYGRVTGKWTLQSLASHTAPASSAASLKHGIWLEGREVERVHVNAARMTYTWTSAQEASALALSSSGDFMAQPVRERLLCEAFARAAGPCIAELDAQMRASWPIHAEQHPYGAAIRRTLPGWTGCPANSIGHAASSATHRILKAPSRCPAPPCCGV